MKNRNYSRLCAADRKVIYNMNQAGKRQIDIALAIGCSQSTISKELARNKGQRGYGPKHSPEQISGAMKLEGLQVSTEGIYQYIIEDTK